jgi:hypothetical protein
VGILRALAAAAKIVEALGLAEAAEELTSQFRASRRWYVSGRIPLPPYR